MFLEKIKNIKLKPLAWLLLCMPVLVALIGFVHSKQNLKKLNKVIINIESTYDNYFIEESEVLKLMSNDDTEILSHKDLDSLNLKTLETRIKKHHFVDDVQINKDLKGNLVVNIEQSKPIARVITDNGKDAYISDQGKLISTSSKFTSRVLVIDGKGANKIFNSSYFQTDQGQGLFALIQYIDNEKFWKAQIAQITIDSKDNLVLTPQIGKEKIEFGQGNDHEIKFRNLMVFYKKILPHKGWNTYETIKLKFKNQIVCEKSSNLS